MKRQIVVITGLSLICSSVVAEPIFMSVDNSQPLTTESTANSNLSYGLSDEEITKRIKQGRADTIPMSVLRRWQKNRKQNQHNQTWQDNSTVSLQQNRTSVMNKKYNAVNTYNQYYANGTSQIVNNNPPIDSYSHQYSNPNYIPPIDNQNLLQPKIEHQTYSPMNNVQSELTTETSAVPVNNIQTELVEKETSANIQNKQLANNEVTPNNPTEKAKTKELVKKEKGGFFKNFFKKKETKNSTNEQPSNPPNKKEEQKLPPLPEGATLIQKPTADKKGVIYHEKSNQPNF